MFQALKILSVESCWLYSKIALGFCASKKNLRIGRHINNDIVILSDDVPVRFAKLCRLGLRWHLLYFPSVSKQAKLKNKIKLSLDVYQIFLVFGFCVLFAWSAISLWQKDDLNIQLKPNAFSLPSIDSYGFHNDAYCHDMGCKTIVFHFYLDNLEQKLSLYFSSFVYDMKILDGTEGDFKSLSNALHEKDSDILESILGLNVNSNISYKIDLNKKNKHSIFLNKDFLKEGLNSIIFEFKQSEEFKKQWGVYDVFLSVENI